MEKPPDSPIFCLVVSGKRANFPSRPLPPSERLMVVFGRFEAPKANFPSEVVALDCSSSAHFTPRYLNQPGGITYGIEHSKNSLLRASSG